MTTSFETAAEVRKYVKEAGFTDRVKISRTSSPFSGNLYFSVALADIPENITLASSSGSRESKRWFSDDPDVAAKYNKLVEILNDTNGITA